MKERRICQLCDSEKGKVDMYVGGYVGFAHEKCIKIGRNTIERYERWVLLTFKIMPNRVLHFIQPKVEKEDES